MNILFAALTGLCLAAPASAGPVKAAAVKEQASNTTAAAAEVKKTTATARNSEKNGIKTSTKKPAAKLTRAQAEKIALERAKGAVVKEAELEKEHGKLVWSFDLNDAGKVREIQVDARTGAIVEDKLETQKEEQAEQAQDAAKK